MSDADLTCEDQLNQPEKKSKRQKVLKPKELFHLTVLKPPKEKKVRKPVVSVQMPVSPRLQKKVRPKAISENVTPSTSRSIPLLNDKENSVASFRRADVKGFSPTKPSPKTSVKTLPRASTRKTKHSYSSPTLDGDISSFNEWFETCSRF
jgi:hypothetical protein